MKTWGRMPEKLKFLGPSRLLPPDIVDASQHHPMQARPHEEPAGRRIPSARWLSGAPSGQPATASGKTSPTFQAGPTSSSPKQGSSSSATATFGMGTSEAVETLQENRDWPVIDRDIHTVTSNELLRTASLKESEADVLIGGPPCQPFSKSGYWASGDTLRLDDPRAGTLGAYLRVLRDILPRVFLLENVPGLAYRSKSEGLELIKKILRASTTIEARITASRSPSSMLPTTAFHKCGNASLSWAPATDENSNFPCLHTASPTETGCFPLPNHIPPPGMLSETSRTTMIPLSKSAVNGPIFYHRSPKGKTICGIRTGEEEFSSSGGDVAIGASC